ncbi:hypothetical protein B0T18DRAFT_466404 [Schizothecium vesticola]|uniref:DUF7779 domain-containing protein n=1 Tax=Schizothecium vesticola TaxID=314040 RepID=A0AA40K5Q0_9PEZI|nr:hypothetical protein B0T18DRAFT_466404 [Schizothecium vesticola]
MANDFASRQHFLRELGTSDSKVVGSSEWPEVSIVIVPSASRSRATHLKHTSWAWLAQIACDARVQGRYYEFQPISTSAGTSVWQSLSDDGDSLLHLLLELGSEAESASPIILISDGLGGISTKKALTRLSERYFEPAIRHLSDRITKAIFIGCPHPTLGNKAQWPFLDHVLRHDRGMDSAARKAAAEEAGIVASLCTKFEEAGSYCPIITTYESQPTTLRHGFNFLRPQRRVLVSRDFAKTCVKGEETVPLDLDKRDIRSISKDSAFTRVFKQRVRSCLTEANERFRLAEQRILHPATCAGNPFASTASEAPGSIDADHHHHQHQHHQQQQHQQENLPLDTSYISAGATRGKSPQLPCYVFGSHPRNPGFFGRSDILAQIDNSILPRGQDLEGRDAETVRSFAICGIGGMGKTQIALEYAYSRKTSFDAIFWITANTKTSIAESFSTIAMSLGIATDTETTDLAVCFSIVLRWLSNPTKTASTQQASWLLIFDNADDIGLMSEYWPHTGVGSVLVTTRDLEGRNFCLGKGVLLQRLSESNALEFFKARLNKHAEMEQLVDPGFVERFGGLPLAIVQVASLIRRRQLTTDEFSEAYGSDLRQSGLDQPQASQHDGGYRHSIFTVWAFESLDETAQALLNLMSLLDPFRIQESILAGDGVADLPHSAYPRSKVDYLNARSALLKTSIVIRSIPTEHVELHPFVQEVVRTRMSKEELRTYFSVAVALVHASWPSGTVKWIHAASRRQQIGSLLPHALKLLAEYERSLLATPLSALTCDLFVNNLQECAWFVPLPLPLPLPQAVRLCDEREQTYLPRLCKLPANVYVGPGTFMNVVSTRPLCPSSPLPWRSRGAGAMRTPSS